MYDNELQVAKKAEQMLTAALQQKTQSFKDHVRGPEETSLKNAKGKARVKQYGLVRNGTKKRYMRSLAIVMPRHGFIQHYGVNSLRSGGARTRLKPKQTSYGFKGHVMKMRAKPFINQAVDNSGVVAFVMENVTRLRSEDLLFELKRIIENP